MSVWVCWNNKWEARTAISRVNMSSIWRPLHPSLPIGAFSPPTRQGLLDHHPTLKQEFNAHDCQRYFGGKRSQNKRLLPPPPLSQAPPHLSWQLPWKGNIHLSLWLLQKIVTSLKSFKWEHLSTNWWNTQAPRFHRAREEIPVFTLLLGLPWKSHLVLAVLPLYIDGNFGGFKVATILVSAFVAPRHFMMALVVTKMQIVAMMMIWCWFLWYIHKHCANWRIQG